jgi:AcrR family transcriptional regulator
MSTTSLTDSLDLDPRLVRSRAKVLAAATELLIESGPRGITVDAVAERSGVAKSTLYRHWSSVHELLVDVMRCNVPAATSIDLSVGFHGALQSWVDQGVATLSAPSWARTLPALLELRSHSPEMEEVLNADFDAKLALIASILELGASEGHVPAGLDPRFVTQTLIGPLVLAALSGDGHLRELAEFVVERFLRSYRP